MSAVTATFDEIFEYTNELIKANKIARDKDDVLLYQINPCGDLFTVVYTPTPVKARKITTVTEQDRRALELGMGVYSFRGTIFIECDRTATVIYKSKSILSIQRKISQLKKQQLHDRVNKILNLHLVN